MIGGLWRCNYEFETEFETVHAIGTSLYVYIVISPVSITVATVRT